MPNEVKFQTTLRVDNRDLPLKIEMESHKDTGVCVIRFGNSFTLSVTNGMELADFAHELGEFGNAVLDMFFEADEEEQAEIDEMNRSMVRLQEKLEACGVTEDYTPDDPNNYDHPKAAGYYIPPSDRQSKVDKLMQGTVSAPEWNPSDPVHW